MDRRQQKTKTAILDAFAVLLSEKSYNKISVQEIIDRANVGRATFYSHYETKDYLLKELCEDLFDHILKSAMGHSAENSHFSNCSAPDSVFLHLLLHLQKNDNHILDLLSSQNNDIFARYFKENLKELVLAQGLAAGLPLPKDYLVNHISSAFVETVNWWLSQNKQVSPEVVTQYFLSVTEPFFQ